MDLTALPKARFYPNINHPAYEPTSVRAGFGWPNVIVDLGVRGRSAAPLFDESSVPFSLLLVTAGTFTVQCGDSVFDVQPDYYVAVRAGERVSAACAGSAGSIIAVFMNPPFVRSVWEASHPIPGQSWGADTVQLFSECRAPDEVSRTIVERVEMFRGGRDRELAVTDADVEDLFCWIIARLAARRLESQRRLRSLPVRDEAYAEQLLIQLSRARAVADSRFADAVGVDDMAEAAGMSKYHFIRRFSDAFDITPYQYLLRVRLEYARDRLERTRDPVSAICGRSGFSSLGSFSWAFKQRFGHSPSAYRRTVGVSKRNYRETA